MLQTRSISILASFAILCLVTIVSTFLYDEEQKQQSSGSQQQFISQSRFKDVEYFLYQKGAPVLLMNSDVLKMSEAGGDRELQAMDFESPRGKAYAQMKKGPVFFKADSGKIWQDQSEIRLSGAVQLSYTGAEFESEKLNFWPKKDYFAAWGNVRSKTQDLITKDYLEIRAKEMQGWPSKKESLYRGGVSGKISKKRVYEEGLDFSSRSLKANMNDSLISLTGDVSIKKQRFTAQAGRAEIYMENFNKKLKYYVLYDDIRMEEKLTLRDGSTLVRKAYSETLEGFQSEGRIVLSGAPRVIQGDDMIKGYRITLRENVEVVEVDDANSIFTIKKE